MEAGLTKRRGRCHSQQAGGTADQPSGNRFGTVFWAFTPGALAYAILLRWHLRGESPENLPSEQLGAQGYKAEPESPR